MMELPDMDIVITFAYGSQEVIELLQQSEDIGKLCGKGRIDFI